MQTTQQLAKALTPYFWISGNAQNFVKNTWFAEFNGKKYVVSKSSFGWHVDGENGEKGVVGEIVYDNKTQALQAIINKG